MPLPYAFFGVNGETIIAPGRFIRAVVPKRKLPTDPPDIPPEVETYLIEAAGVAIVNPRTGVTTIFPLAGKE